LQQAKVLLWRSDAGMLFKHPSVISLLLPSLQRGIPDITAAPLTSAANTFVTND
jgi:hypothetical protein